MLAHELGHFKLHHVRWAILRSVATSGVLLLRAEPAAAARRPSTRPSRWSGPRTGRSSSSGSGSRSSSFLLQPLENALSRAHEFAADRFALARRGVPRRARRRARASCASAAGCCRSRTRSTRASTTPTRRSSSACARWARCNEGGGSCFGPSLSREGLGCACARSPVPGPGLVARFGDPGPSPAMASPSVARALAQQGAGLFPEGADCVLHAVGALREEARALLGEGTRD